jgi:hypothetical protein
MKKVLAMVMVLSGSAALVGLAGAQSVPPNSQVRCPRAEGATNGDPNAAPTPTLNNRISISSFAVGQTAGADCWTGPNYAGGVTRARGWARRLSNGVALQAYMFGSVAGEARPHRSARVQGWSSQGLSAGCYVADATADGTPVPPVFMQDFIGQGPCSGVQEFRVIALE